MVTPSWTLRRGAAAAATHRNATRRRSRGFAVLEIDDGKERNLPELCNMLSRMSREVIDMASRRLPGLAPCPDDPGHRLALPRRRSAHRGPGEVVSAGAREEAVGERRFSPGAAVAGSDGPQP